MAGFDKCIETLSQAAGRPLTDDEVDYLFKEVRKRRDFIKAKGKADTLEEAALKAADELANNIKMSAVIEKRNAALNLTKRMTHVDWAQQNYGTKVAEPLETLLVGTNRAKEGARDGVAQTQQAIVRNYLSSFTADMVRDDLMPIFSSGVLDRDITRALWAIGNKLEEAKLSKLPKEAVQIAKILHKYEELARVDANKEGAWIRKAAGYVVKQNHDQFRIARAGEAAWRADAARLFDLDRMLVDAPDANVQAMLGRLYTDLASGNHLKALKDDATAGFTGPANLAKKVSQSREIYFKDADAWFDYNNKYGGANLREAFVGGLRSRAEATGLMRVLGTNPEAMLQRIEQELTENAKIAGDVASLKDLNNSRNELDNYMAAVDGSMNSPVNVTAARVSAGVRSVQTMAKLGGMIASQLNDLAIYGMSMRYNGRGFLSSMGEAVGSLGSELKTPAKMDLLASLDVVLDSLVGEIGRTGSFNDPGSMTKAMQLFMKMNLSQWWTERLRSSAAMGLSHNLARQKSKAFADLPSDLIRSLGTYGIDAKKWELLRKLPQKLADGREYMTADQIASMPDNLFSNKAEKVALENSLRNYIVDNTGFAVLEPDAKTRALLLQGSKPGTWTGEFYRFATQFKSFTGAYMQKAMGREIFGRGYEGDNVLKGLRAGNGEMRGLSQLILMTTLLGYGSMALKDLMKGRPVRDITDPDKSWKVFLAAMVQGGGAGIYGDFLFGEASRTGGTLAESVVGPVPSATFRFVNLYHKALRGDDVAANALNQTLANAPFMNLFYTRIALDYLLIYDMQESLNPGYLGRMERRIEKENNGQMWLSPTQDRMRPFTN